MIENYLKKIQMMLELLFKSNFAALHAAKKAREMVQRKTVWRRPVNFLIVQS
jgi:hypothetical protein